MAGEFHAAAGSGAINRARLEAPSAGGVGGRSPALPSPSARGARSLPGKPALRADGVNPPDSGQLREAAGRT